MRFEGKNALITGGGSGQGEKIGLELARSGANIVILDLARDKAEKVAQQVRALNRKAMAMAVDITDFRAVNDCVKKALDSLGHIQFLVNAAGYGQYGLFSEMSEEVWDRSIAVHLKGVFNSTRAVINDMIGQKFGRIINISSVGGIVGSARHTQYCAAKAGVIGLTRALAKEVAPHGITVNAVAPGAVDTPFLDNIKNQSPELFEHYVKSVPLGRLGKPEEIAALCVFLMSENGDYFTGQVISPNGGSMI